MAVTQTRAPAGPARNPFVRLAGIASIGLLALAGAGVIAALSLQPGLAGWVLALGVVGLACLFALGAVGVQAFRGRIWAQQTLLVFWLAMLASCVVVVLAAL